MKSLLPLLFIGIVADKGFNTEHPVELGYNRQGPAMRLSEQDIQVAIDAGSLLDLCQSQKSSLILCSIKTYESSIGFQAPSLPRMS